jgi:hypothetical protein
VRSWRGQWQPEPLESSLPHEIVDTDGRVRAPLPGMRPFKNRGAASRFLTECIFIYDKRRKDARNDPRNWTVRPIHREGVK